MILGQDKRNKGDKGPQPRSLKKYGPDGTLEQMNLDMCFQSWEAFEQTAGHSGPWPLMPTSQQPNSQIFKFLLLYYALITSPPWNLNRELYRSVQLSVEEFSQWSVLALKRSDKSSTVNLEAGLGMNQCPQLTEEHFHLDNYSKMRGTAVPKHLQTQPYE